MFFYVRLGDRIIVCKNVCTALRYLAAGWEATTEAEHRAAWRKRDEAIRAAMRRA